MEIGRSIAKIRKENSTAADSDKINGERYGRDEADRK